MSRAQSTAQEAVDFDEAEFGLTGEPPWNLSSILELTNKPNYVIPIAITAPTGSFALQTPQPTDGISRTWEWPLVH